MHFNVLQVQVSELLTGVDESIQLLNLKACSMITQAHTLVHSVSVRPTKPLPVQLSSPLTAHIQHRSREAKSLSPPGQTPRNKHRALGWFSPGEEGPGAPSSLCSGMSHTDQHHQCCPSTGTGLLTPSQGVFLPPCSPLSPRSLLARHRGKGHGHLLPASSLSVQADSALCSGISSSSPFAEQHLGAALRVCLSSGVTSSLSLCGGLSPNPETPGQAQSCSPCHSMGGQIQQRVKPLPCLD